MKVKSKLMAALASFKDSDIELAIQRSIDRHISASTSLYNVHEIHFLVSNSPGSTTYLARRISNRLKTARYPAVALKTLLLLHQLLRGGDRYFEQDLRSSCLSGDLRIDLTGRSADPLWSSTLKYSIFLEERVRWAINQSGKLEPASWELELQSYDLVIYRLSKCQVFLDLVMDCLPAGGLSSGHVMELALTVVLRESFKVYESFREGVEIVGGAFLGLKKPARVLVIDVLRKACSQTLSLHGFYEGCKREFVGKKLDYPSVRIVTDAHVSSLELAVMEEKEWKGSKSLFGERLETKVSTVWVEFEEGDSETSSFSIGGIDDGLEDVLLKEEVSSKREGVRSFYDMAW